ncbi:MAG TPA: nicotinamide riboside transporter PnuC [Aeromonadales bacterium]|nr:nicotinamide riboside transporter PnuC [Aeromonadales bacterium]
MSIIEAVAVIFGLAAVWLNVRQNIWGWPAGLVQVVLYIFVFYEAKLYSDLILSVIYIFLQLYGWYSWLYGGEKHSKLKVSCLSPSLISFWIVVCISGTLMWGYFMQNNTDAALPYPDAFTTVASLIAQYLMTRKKLESWILWVIVDVVAISVYFIKGLYLTTGLYSVFLIMSVFGYLLWKKSLEEEKVMA